MKKPTRETNRTAAIRRVLARAGKPLDLFTLWEKVERELRMVIGRKQLYDLLSMMQHHGEITTAGRAETRTYQLQPPRNTTDQRGRSRQRSSSAMREQSA